MKLGILRLWGLVVAIAIVGWIAFRVGMYAYAHHLLDKHGRATRSSGQVVEVVVSSRQEADALLPYLRYLPSLRQLSVTKVPLSDAHLQSIGILRGLHRLQLSNCDLTDDDLRHLRGLTSLNRLTLSFNPIRGSGLKHLRELRALSLLSLGATDFDGPGIEELAVLPKLHELSIGSTAIDDKGMTYVARLSHLRIIHLGKTNITENGLMQLVDCLWLMNIGFPSSIVPENPDIREWRRSKDEMLVRFREARLKAIREARASGEDAPPESALPFRYVEAFMPAEQ